MRSVPLTMTDTYLGRLFSERFHDTQCTQVLKLRDIQAIPLRIIRISDVDSSYQTHGFKDLDAPTRSIAPSKCPVNRHHAPPNKGGNQGAASKKGRGRGTCGLGTRGRGTWGRGDPGTWVRGTRKRCESGTWDVGTRGCDKQTTPDFFAEFVKYNFRCSREGIICWRVNQQTSS